MADLPIAGGFVFEPRKQASVPGQFGRTALQLAPASGVTLEDPRFRAAQLQHQLVNVVREALVSTGLSLHAFVEAQPSKTPGLGYDRLVRIQRGETMMQLADFFHWAGHFPAVGAALAAYRYDLPVIPTGHADNGADGAGGAAPQSHHSPEESSRGEVGEGARSAAKSTTASGSPIRS